MEHENLVLSKELTKVERFGKLTCRALALSRQIPIRLRR